MSVALVTGAGKRLGASIAEALGAGGWTVAVHYRNSKAGAEDVRDRIIAAGGKAETFQADLGESLSSQTLIAEVNERLGPVTCLINSASMFDADELVSLSAASMTDHFNANLRGPVLLSRDMANLLPEGEQGVIINLLDNKLYQPNRDYIAYSLTKYGLAGFTEMAALALAPRIRVNGIAPGLVLRSGEQTDEEFEETHRLNPLQKGVNAEDIIRAVRYFIDADRVTGDIMVIDGGQNLARASRDIAFLFGNDPS